MMSDVEKSILTLPNMVKYAGRPPNDVKVLE
jgi:hypothetical protein